MCQFAPGIALSKTVKKYQYPGHFFSKASKSAIDYHPTKDMSVLTVLTLVD